MVEKARHDGAASPPSDVTPPDRAAVRPRRRTAEGKWTKWGVIFGGLGAAAGVIALWPAFAGKGPDGDPGAVRQTPTSPATSASSASTPAGTGPGTSTASSGSSRTLVSLPLARGAGAIRREGEDLVMQCGTNQSDDRYREVEYSVPATTSFARFEAGLQTSADGSPDQRVGLQLFVRDQYARADQTVQEAVRTLAPNSTTTFAAQIPQGTAAVVLRLTCYLPGSSLRITDPHLIGG